MVVLQRSPPLTRWAAKGHKPAILFASIDRAQIVTIRVDIVQRRSSTVPDCCAYMSEQSTLLVFSSLWVSCWVMALLPPGGTTRQHIRGTQGDLRGHLTVTTGLFGVGQVYTLNKLHQIPGNPVESLEISQKNGLPLLEHRFIVELFVNCCNRCADVKMEKLWLYRDHLVRSRTSEIYSMNPHCFVDAVSTWL